MLRKYIEDGWRVDGVCGWMEDGGWTEYGTRIGRQGRLEDAMQVMVEGANPQGRYERVLVHA